MVKKSAGFVQKFFQVIGILFLVLVVLVFSLKFLVYPHIAEVYRVVGASMADTLKPGDRIVVDKRAYRDRLPQRGDIVFFKSPSDTRKVFFCRIVALGEERLEIRGGNIFVNDQKIDQGVIADNYYENIGSFAKPGQVIVVPPRHYYVLGDHSVTSNDSRFWGFLPAINVFGKATRILWPLDRAGAIR